MTIHLLPRIMNHVDATLLYKLARPISFMKAFHVYIITIQNKRLMLQWCWQWQFFIKCPYKELICSWIFLQISLQFRILGAI